MLYGHTGRGRLKNAMKKRSGEGAAHGQQDTSTARWRWRRQHRAELDGK